MREVVTEGDISRFSPDERRLLSAIRSVPRTGGTVVPCEGDPRAALALAIDCGGLDRATLILVRDRPAALIAVEPRDRPGSITIAELLERDHRRLDDLAARAVTALASGQPLVPNDVVLFVEGLRRHMRIEEDVLFPACESNAETQTSRPLQVIRHEHRSIEALLSTLLRETPRTGAGTPAQQRALQAAFANLSALLEQHDAKEERVLFPSCDELIPATDRGSVIRKMVVF